MPLRFLSSLSKLTEREKPQAAAPPTPRPQDVYTHAPPIDYSQDPIERAFQMQRYGIIASCPAEWSGQPQFARYFKQAEGIVDDVFALVPEGAVSLLMGLNDEPGAPETDCKTRPYLLSIQAVTNEQFQAFVDDNGYENYDLFPQQVWAHLIDFRDQTGQSSPRFWRNGRHDARLAKHPVVGICFYEALAYARWAGYRLPTEAEWQMAACWQVDGTDLQARRYPWGDALDLDRCNIWSSSKGGTVPVDACPGGAAPNGVLQLIGNTWEWVDSDFQCKDEDGVDVVGESPLKSIRGGAFDTYFPWQATSTFRTGLGHLARVQNVGFRCALDMTGD